MNPRIRQLLIITALFTLSAAVRVWWSDFHAPLGGDEGEYHLLANRLLAGDGFVDDGGAPTAWRTPGFPLFLALVYAVTGPDPAYARLAIFSISALTTAIVYLLALNLFNRQFTALAAAGIWVFLPTGIFLGASLYGESLSAFLLSAAFLAAAVCGREKRSSIAWAIFPGLLAGAAVLTRGYLIFALAALPLYFLFSKKDRKLAAVCLVFSALLPAIWIGRNSLALGSPTFSTEGTEVIWHGNNRWSRGGFNVEWNAPDSPQRDYLAQKYPGFFEELSEMQRSRIYLREAAADISAEPGRVLLLAPRKILVLLTPYSYMGLDWLYAACFPFAIAGAALILKQKEKRRLFWLLIFPLICVAAICVLTFGDPRFRHPVDFCVVALSALGITRTADRIRKGHL